MNNNIINYNYFCRESISTLVRTRKGIGGSDYICKRDNQLINFEKLCVQLRRETGETWLRIMVDASYIF